MKHLTVGDFRLLLDTPGAPVPPALAGHLESCGLCAASYEIFYASITPESESADDAGCPSGNDVYELFRDRLPSERLPPLGHHLLRCERCGEFFGLLAGKGTLPPRVRALEVWLSAARESKAAVAAYRITNEYALAASGNAKVIEAMGKLKNGAAFTVTYRPDKTVFRMNKADAEGLRVKVYADERWLEGWDELDDGSFGFELASHGVGNIHLAAQGDEVGEAILTMPYELLG